MSSKKTLAFYIRLSSEDEDLHKSGKAESNSITNQRTLLRDYYDSHPELQAYQLAEFCDDGFSGTNFDRPRFAQMMQMVRQGEIHAVMVKDLSRFGRDYLEVGVYLELIFPLLGTRFIAVNDQFDSNDYLGTTGGVELALRNLINGLYSRDLSIKIKSANRTRNRRGEYWGGAAFYGYQLDPKDKHKLVVDTKVSGIVVRIFQECIAGNSASQIAKGLNEDGISSPAKYKHRKGALYNGRIVDEASIWTASTVLRILKDERYTGKMISHTRETDGITVGKMVPMPREAWIVVPDTHEAIVSQNIFDAAAATRSGRIKTVNANTSGYKPENLFVCGYCGRKLAKAYGTVTHFYCLKARVYSDSPCAVIHEPIEDLQNQVLKVVNMMSSVLAERVAEIKADNAQEIPSVEKKIAEAQTHLQRLQAGKLDLYEDYRQGRITRDKFISIQKSRQQEADRLHSSLALLEGRLEMLRKKAERMDTLATDTKVIQMLPDYRPEVIRRLVQCVRVYGAGRIEVDLLENDDYLVEILDSVKSLAV